MKESNGTCNSKSIIKMKNSLEKINNKSGGTKGKISELTGESIEIT
jgi:hypothetical protein